MVMELASHSSTVRDLSRPVKTFVKTPLPPLVSSSLHGSDFLSPPQFLGFEDPFLLDKEAEFGFCFLPPVSEE